MEMHVMQAIVYHGVHHLSLENLPEPRPAPNEVLIRVNVCGICGSDLHGYLGHSPRRDAHVPLVMGHEFSGKIVEIGSDVKSNLSIGDTVVVNPVIYCGYCRACRSGLHNICPNMAVLGIERHGAFAEWVTVPADRVFMLPDGLNNINGSMTETLAVEVHLFRKYAPPLLRTVVVLGAGAQGLLAVQLARISGASEIVVSDIVPQRLAMAEQMGATITIQADREDAVKRVMAATGGWGAEFVIDAVGSPVVRQQGLAMLGPNGTFGMVGLGPGETPVSFNPVVNKEISIHGSYAYTDDDFERSLELLATRQIEVDSMIHVANLNEGITYFQRLIDEPAGLTKVVLKAQ
jgi:2-desacetyl-2-hydroxyethyl bacteriochlorophyllide A dehydrogenase